MRKKIIALTTLGFFIAFSNSCAIYSLKKTSLDSIEPEKREGLIISRAQTKTGDCIDFAKKPPAKIWLDQIVGDMFLKKVEIQKNNIMTAIIPKDEKSFPSRYGIPRLITTKNGTVYRAMIFEEKGDSWICDAYVAISLPLSDIVSVWQKKTDIVATIMLNALPFAVVGILATILLLTDPMSLSMGGW